MRAVDTNVLLGYLVAGDSTSQAARTAEFISSCEAARENVYVSCIVLCELAWVLRRFYALSKAEIVYHIQQLLVTDIFQVEEAESVHEAVQLSRQGPGDFSDYLLGQLNLAHGCRLTATFDRKLHSDPAFLVL
jgi:predicted nucleic-acid-binding protein